MARSESSGRRQCDRDDTPPLAPQGRSKRRDSLSQPAAPHAGPLLGEPLGSGPDPLSFVGRLTSAEVNSLLRHGRRRRWRRGAVLCLEGEASGWVAVLLSGSVKASASIDDGREVVLSLHGPGAVVGALEAADGKPRPATVSALEPVEAMVISKDAFTSFLCANERVGWQLVKMLCERLRDADQKRIEYGVADTAARVANRLIELAERFGQPADRGLRISVALTQNELAAWTGSSREAVSKALGALRRRGWIETGRRSLVVRDLTALREHARRTEHLADSVASRYASAWSMERPA